MSALELLYWSCLITGGFIHLVLLVGLLLLVGLVLKGLALALEFIISALLASFVWLAKGALLVGVLWGLWVVLSIWLWPAPKVPDTVTAAPVEVTKPEASPTLVPTESTADSKPPAPLPSEAVKPQ